MAMDFSTRFATAWVPVQETASELRHEFTALDTLVQEAFADVDQLRVELEAKADELDEARRQLAERGRQLAEHRKDSNRLTHQLEQQETHLSETLTELRELRQQFTLEQDAARQRQTQEIETTAQRAAQLEAERDELRTQLQLAQAAAGSGGGDAALTALLHEIASLRNQVVETRTDLSAAIERSVQVPLLSASENAASGQSAEQLAQLVQARAELKNELELVRTQQETQLGDALAELRALRVQLTAEQEAARQRQSQENETIAQRAANLEAERDELRMQLHAQLQLAQAAIGSEGDDAPLAALLQEITSLRAQVLETRTDLSAAIERSAQVPVLAASESAAGGESSEQLAELAQEKTELENELELVRTRAAELHETVAEQKNQLREERSITATELKELRRLVEQQADLLAQLEPAENVRDSVPAPRISIPTKPPAPAVSNTAVGNPSVSAEEAAPSDPVVNSVMAQFAKLQKDVAQRRKKK